MMINNQKNKRDLQLLCLLVERELDQRGCEPGLLRTATTDLQLVDERQDRYRYELLFDLMNGLRVSVTNIWWADRDHDVGRLCRQASEVADTVEAPWQRREDVQAMRDEVAAAVKGEVAKGRRRGLPYRMLAAEVCPIEAGNTEFPYIHVTLERLSNSLVLEKVKLEFEEEDEVTAAFAGMLALQKARRAQQVRLQALQADGEIDLVALRILQTAGCDVPAILARLPHADGGILDVVLPGPEQRDLMLFWKEGVVHARGPLSEGIDWSDGSVLFAAAPKGFPARPEGRLLSDFIRHHALPDDLRIVPGDRLRGRASVSVEVGTVLFNSQTGAILPA